MKKKKIALVFGGYSTEYYASCISAANILRNFDYSKFDVMKIGITIQGKWLFTNAEANGIEDGVQWIKDENNKDVTIRMDRNKCDFLILEEGKYKSETVDCIFLITHGYKGEDGSLQGVMELTNIPYVSCDVVASACSMDKRLTKLFVDRIKVKRPKSINLNSEDYILDEKFKSEFNYPVFVKPAKGGSSVGITKVKDEKELHKAIMHAFKFDNNIIIEEGINGRELSVAIIGNKEIELGSICEIITSEKAPFSYETKYINPTAKMQIPAELDPKIQEQIEKIAKDVYKILGCEIWARVDLFLSDENELYFNEINTIPAFTNHSIVPLTFKEKGVEPKEIISKLISLAFERNCEKKALDINLVEKIV